MNVTIHGQNIKISDTLEDYTRGKVERLTRYMPNIADLRVDLSRQNASRGEDVTTAQITLRHSRGAILRAEEKLRGNGEDTLQAAVGLAVDKMYRQIRRFKGKKTDNKRRGRNKYMATAEELALAEELPEEYETPEEPEAYDDNLEILRRKEVDLVAMDEQEAVEQMELLGHSFFIFLNGQTGIINVLYRRASGGYGILIPANQA